MSNEQKVMKYAEKILSSEFSIDEVPARYLDAVKKMLKG